MAYLAWGYIFVSLASPEEEAGQEGFEPPSLGFGVRCSNRSSYWPVRPLPYNYYRLPNTVDITAFLGAEYAGGKNDNIS